MSRFKYPVDTDQFQRIREDGKVYVDKNDADKAIAAIEAAGEEAYVLGELVNSEEGVIIA